MADKNTAHHRALVLFQQLVQHARFTKPILWGIRFPYTASDYLYKYLGLEFNYKHYLANTTSMQSPLQLSANMDH